MLKPLDLQTIMPRSVDLQRMQHIDQVRPTAEQQEMSRETIQQTQLKQAQVQTNEATDNMNRIHDEDTERDKKRERRYRRFQNAQQHNESETETNPAVDTKRGQHIDFKV